MDRQIVYVGSVPTDTDQLLQSRNTMVGLGYALKAIIGDGAAWVDGLACTPGSGLSVTVAPGSLIVPGVVDTDYYGSLPPDGDPVVKIAINTEPTTLVVPGTGATFLVCGAFSESAGGMAVLPYYNAASPGQTMFGVGGQGNAQATVMQERVALQIVAGTTPPAGYLALWVVTVPSGATAITAAMIAVSGLAPFMPLKLPQAAPLVSPGFSGVPTAPTPPAGDLSNRLATTQFLTGYVNKTGDVMSGALGVPTVYQIANNLALQDPAANVVTGSLYTPGHLTLFNTTGSVATLGVSRQGSGGTIVNFASATDAGSPLAVGSISLAVTNGVASGVNYNTTSDYRLKTEVCAIAPDTALANLTALRPVQYRWCAAAGDERTRGFIAHEFGEVYPTALTGQKDAVDADGRVVPQMIDQTRAIPDLVAAVAALARKVARLEAALATEGARGGQQHHA